MERNKCITPKDAFVVNEKEKTIKMGRVAQNRYNNLLVAYLNCGLNPLKAKQKADEGIQNYLEIFLKEHYPHLVTEKEEKNKVYKVKE